MIKSFKRLAGNEKVLFTLDRIPLAAIVGLSGFILSSIILLLFGQFKAELIWPIGILLALIGIWMVIRFGGAVRPGTNREKLFFDIVVFVGVIGWGAWNFPLTTQHVLTDRDPATYAVASGWLAQHESFSMDSSEKVKSVEGIKDVSAGFTTKDGVLHAQGQHLLPALLGALGKFFGPTKVLHLNILFGMTALLAVYCFGRLFLRPGWAFLAAAIMAFSLPLLYFSRDTYTEPLALTFTFGALALIWIAQQQRSLLIWGLAGLVAGTSLLTRIDSYLALVGIAAFFAVYVAIGKQGERTLRVKETAAFWFPAALMGVLAFLDLKLLSEAYYIHSKKLITYELLALLGVVFVGLAINVVVVKYPGLLKKLNKKTVKWRAAAALVLVVVGGLLLASRPLWYEAPSVENNGIVADIQEMSGAEPEARTYAELTTYWVNWYVGPVIAALGLLGLAIAAYKSMNDKKLLLLCSLFVIAGLSVVYLVSPSITPDQIWASRRLLPVILPGVVVFGVYALSIGVARVSFPSRFIKMFSVAAVSAGLLIAPLATSAPFLNVPLKKQYNVIEDACAALPENSVVVLVGMARLNATQPLRTYCKVETYNFSLNRVDKPTKEKLIELALTIRNEGRLPVLGIFRDQYGGLIPKADFKNLTEMEEAKYFDMVSTLDTPPRQVRELERHLSFGVINKDGSLSELPKK